jgi:hypothetical protein
MYLGLYGSEAHGGDIKSFVDEIKEEVIKQRQTK